ncbi:uncharacterized protein STEHIDRAFT_122155, partial [Stereum hirsutum FP-91666 SS1]|uniref:uncharacterized protein n=1 Tax=Stereum hirsutum (strain FP-91666) TaxID=721885 RepID=UPI0004449BBA
MRIDHIHSRVQELFVEGSSSRAIAPHASPMILSGQGSHNGPNESLRGIAVEQRDGTAELGQKILWLANVGRLLPAVIMHHREHNLIQLTSPLFSPARSTIIRAVNEFAFADKPEPQWQDEAIIPAALLEQLSFCVTFMFFAGDASSLITRPSHLPHSTSIQFYNALLGYGHRHSQRRGPSNIEYLSPTSGAGDYPC